MHRTALIMLVAAVGLLGAAPAAAQRLSGMVIDARTGRLLESVRVVVSRPGDDAVVTEGVTGDRGRFTLELPEAGEWVVRGERIGYAPVVSDPIEVGANEEVTVALRLAVEAVPLEPMTVSGRAQISAGLRGFYTRLEQSELTGRGHFLERADIERMGTSQPTQVFRNVVSLRVRPGARGRGDMLRMADGCVPALYLDGVQINFFDHTTSLDDFVAADAIAAVEVYRDTWVEGFTDPRGCGLVLVWTTKGSAQPSTSDSPTWLRVVAGTGVVAALVLLLH